MLLVGVHVAPAQTTHRTPKSPRCEPTQGERVPRLGQRIASRGAHRAPRRAFRVQRVHTTSSASTVTTPSCGRLEQQAQAVALALRCGERPSQLPACGRSSVRAGRTRRGTVAKRRFEVAPRDRLPPQPEAGRRPARSAGRAAAPSRSPPIRRRATGPRCWFRMPTAAATSGLRSKNRDERTPGPSGIPAHDDAGRLRC